MLSASVYPFGFAISDFRTLSSLYLFLLVPHPTSLDHSIRSRQHVRRNRQADIFGRFQIDHELELCRLLHRQVRAIVAGSLCLLSCHDNDPDGIFPNSDSVLLSEGGPLVTALWLAADKVIHHDDIVLPIIIRSWGDVAGCDPDPRDERVVKHDAEEGKAPVTW